MIFLFWIGIFLLAHTYLVYPFTLQLLVPLLKKKQDKQSASQPKVSILVAVYNEEKIIREKIQNLLELDYPKEKLEILFGSDCSSDNTNELIEKEISPEHKMKLFKFKSRRGKAAVLNSLAPQASGEILLFCDANTMLLQNSVQQLIANFSNEKTGCVCGRLVLKDATGSMLGKGESFYWKFESEIKYLEGKLGIVMGANGGIYAIRKELYVPIPEGKTVMDDFFLTTQIISRRYQAVYEPLSIGREETSLDKFGEFRRKVRIGEANFNYLPLYIKMLNPLLGITAYSFFSHKFLRWIGPLLLIMVFLLNILIQIVSPSPLFLFLFGLQALFYLFAILGYFIQRKGKKSRLIFTIAYYFSSMNFALFLGMVKAARQRKHHSGGMWDREERTH
ncbi:MAG: glycosyltransferase family 2 protein [Fibrobacteria bacterium]|nr:glycosyltransferase family 2 protein [Fibrobacteria bacterium]